LGVVLNSGDNSGEGCGRAARVLTDGLELAEEAVLLVSLNKLITHGPDLRQGELRGCVWVHHGGVVDILALAGKECLNSELLDVDVCADMGRELWREVTDIRGLDALLVYEAGHFH